MYTDKNIIYADPGKYLKYNNQVSFQFPANNEVEEHILILDDLIINNNMALYNDRLFAQPIISNYTYADYKRDIIKKRYSNDDQIAIILNKEDSEEDLIRYNSMMEWRIFASRLANKIIEVINK